jgi:hypothetical protein
LTAALLHSPSNRARLPRSQFFILERIGSGEFGDVLKAVLFSEGIATMCAAKKLKDMTVESRKQFLREAVCICICTHVARRGDLCAGLCFVSEQKKPD